ncbi:LLM class flavin-dependent oxidoreductase [Nonomuraea turkmeniaca]|uniref:LLM class flavin-dependent oxidoreductase n=1 Tax=Nonomuraea turkmeniaca TaxID=103838 RepID=A0A5S4GB63_9ACTN|nr:LLM class flavin-dependent oxidoreductase [Nonomuraea turkmeniaca]TMR23250.1 LLM class flavin-dependent oxidoreductase [Nonomuraea turkmeniaca]
MRITTSLPANDSGLPAIAMARHLEALGYDAVGMPDLLIGDGTPGFDPTLVLAAVAATTSRIKLEFGVLTLPLRPTAWIAAQIQTLQHLSGDRVVLGVGIGGFPGSPFWRAAGGAQQGERGRRADAALELLPRLIGGEPAEVIPGEELVLAPAATVPPILIGGNSEAAMRRAVLYGDGWAPSLITPEALTGKAARLREIADELGRPVPSISVGGHAFLAGDTAAALESFVRSLVDMHRMSPEEAAGVPVTGSPAQVAERLAAYAAAGADAVGLGLDGGDWARQAELLAEAASKSAA